MAGRDVDPGRPRRLGHLLEAVIALETRLARLQWTRVENRDPLKTYNKCDIAALPALMAKDDWPSYLAAGGVGSEIRDLVVAQPSYFDGVGEILREVPLTVWQAYLAYNLLSAYAPYLSAPFVAEDFAFEQHTLRGVRDKGSLRRSRTSYPNLHLRDNCSAV